MPIQFGKLFIRKHSEPLEKTEITWQFRKRTRPWRPFALRLHNEQGFEYVLSTDQKWARFEFQQTPIIIPNEHKAIGWIKGMLRLLEASHEILRIEEDLLKQAEEEKRHQAELEQIRQEMQRKIAGEMEARIINEQTFTPDTVPDRDAMSGKFFRGCTFKGITFPEIVGTTFLVCTFDGCDMANVTEEAGCTMFQCTYLNEPPPKAEVVEPEKAEE